MGQKEDRLFDRLKKTVAVRLSLVLLIVVALVLLGAGLMMYFYVNGDHSDPRSGNVYIILLGVCLLMVIALMVRASKSMRQLGDITAVKERMERDLQIASGIQMSMVPKTFPPFPERNDLDMAASIVPAKEVGGDLYDFYIRDGKLFFCIGDVSGKGVPASLVMAVTRTMFRTVSAHVDSPAKIVTQMNDSMADMNESNMFVTFFCGALDLRSGELAYCNAGHNPPLILTDTIASLPVEANLPLGIVHDQTYKEQRVALAADDAIFLYTDGLTEAENSRHEQFGEKRMEEVLHGRKEAQAHLENIKAQVAAFVGDAEQSDDLTMLFIHYLGCGEPAARHLTLDNVIEEISKLPAFVQEACGKAGMDDSLTSQLNLALEEMVSNVILYAYPEGVNGPVDIDAILTAGNLSFVITDSGKPFDPTAAGEVDITAGVEDRPIGGLGIHIVRQIMDRVAYERKDGKNILTITKKL